MRLIFSLNNIENLVELTRNIFDDIFKINLEEDIEEAIIIALVKLVGKVLTQSRIKKYQVALVVEKS